MTYDAETQMYSYPCPCGDRFKVSLEDLWDGEDIAYCQSCTLFIQVIYEEADLPPPPAEEDDDNDDDDNKQQQSKDDVTKREQEHKDDNDQGTDDDIVKAAEKLSISSQWEPLVGWNNITVLVRRERDNHPWGWYFCPNISSNGKYSPYKVRQSHALLRIVMFVCVRVCECMYVCLPCYCWDPFKSKTTQHTHSTKRHIYTSSPSNQKPNTINKKS